MQTAPFPSLTPRELVRLLIAKRKLLVGPALACGLLAAAYSLVMPRYWEATQALVVRQETAGSRSQTPGRFADLYEMRTLQETILELAKSQQVVSGTLMTVNQQRGGSAEQPTAKDIEEFRQRLKMLPPDGGEFGKTEVFYFSVRDPSRERAMALVGELCRQLDQGLKELRAARAESIIAELEQEVAAATATLDAETRRLSEFEAQVGGDLGELRMLHSASSGQSDLRQEAVQLEADHRKFETQVRETEALLALLRAAEQDPQQLIATPNSLLASQPALRRLKDGLLDAQLATAKLAGTRSAEHPKVKAAAEAEKQIREDLHRELVSAIKGAEIELRLGQQRLATTDARRKNLDGRLDRLAEQRAEYSNRVAAAENSRQSLDHARQNLNIAMAAEAAANSGSLITRLDEPETGPYPAGPGRTVVTCAGAMGGLMLGLGLIFLTTGTTNIKPATDDRRNAESAPTSHAQPAAPETPPAQQPTQRDQYIAAATLQGVVMHPAPAAAKPQVQRHLPAAPPAPAAGQSAPTGNKQVRKAPLPITPGALPTVSPGMPPLAAPPTGGVSLQEALEAAQAAQR